MKQKTIDEGLNEFMKITNGMRLDKAIKLVMIEVLSLKQEIQKLKEHTLEPKTVRKYI